MKKFYHLLILDASGSMTSIYKQALSGCNETIQSIRGLQQSHEDCQHYLNLVSFHSEKPRNIIFDNQPIMDVRDVTADDYVLGGCTPLYDCMGLSILRLQDTIAADRKKTEEEQAKNDIVVLADPKMEETNVLVTVITDGYENASTLFDAPKLKSLVEECKAQGWTFAFIGANQDDVMEAGKLGIHNSMRFATTEAGTREMFRDLSDSVVNYCCCSMAAPMPSEMKESGFFKKKSPKK